MMTSHLLTVLVAISAGSGIRPDDSVNFTRTYKPAEKAVYIFSQSTHIIQENTLTVNMTVTAQKLLDQGRAQLLFQFSDLKTSDQTTLPDDVTLSTGANNLPAAYTPTKGSMNFVSAWLLLAGATADKPVKSGDEIPINWDSGSEFGSCKGTMKILEIDSLKKRLKASIDLTWTGYGQTLGKFKLTSLYDTTDFSLVSSSGKMLLGGSESQAQEMSFTRKSP